MTKDEIAKQEILIQAQKLFQVYGLKKTTMDEIAAACGKAKSTLYHYFKSKEEVFESVFQMELRDLRTQVKSIVDKKENLTGKINAYIIEFYRLFLSKINVYRVVNEELDHDSTRRYYFDRLMTFERSYITRLLEEGYDMGEFNEFEKKDIPWFSELVIAAFMGIARYSVETENRLDQEKMEKAVSILAPRLFP